MEKISMKPEDNMIEVARSFSQKVNLGNFENQDFFCSMKATCQIAQFDEVSNMLFDMCRAKVMEEVEKVRQEKFEKENKKQLKVEQKDEQLMIAELENNDDNL